jgi:hypothetical protein
VSSFSEYDAVCTTQQKHAASHYAYQVPDYTLGTETFNDYMSFVLRPARLENAAAELVGHKIPGSKEQAPGQVRSYARPSREVVNRHAVLNSKQYFLVWKSPNMLPGIRARDTQTKMLEQQVF